MNRRDRPNDFHTLDDVELLEHYRGFVQSIPTGGVRCAGKTEAKMLREMEAEIARRQREGGYGAKATLKLGGAEAVVNVKANNKA